jgi:ParB family chromosome partitioning protein
MVPGTYQPRTRMDEGALYELAESIKAQGIMQPISSRLGRRGLQRIQAFAAAGCRGAAPRKGVYEIIAGERRFRAAQPGRPGQRARAGARRAQRSRRRHGAD